MSGTFQGGRKASVTNKAKYGEDFYKRIGILGGKKGHTGGFYANRELASRVGRVGGLISTRSELKPTADEVERIKKQAGHPRSKGKIWDIVRSVTHA